MTQRGGWGRSRGTRKCGKRRTSEAGFPVICSKLADGSHTEHRGRERGGDWRWFTWGSEPKAPLVES